MRMFDVELFIVKGCVQCTNNNIFWPKKPYASWVKDTTTAQWKSPIGDAPALTAEQEAAGTFYTWNEGTGAWDPYTPPA